MIKKEHIVKENSICKLLEQIKEEANIGKSTHYISENEASKEIQKYPSEYVPYSTANPKLKRRRDVIFKAILRECRRFLQIKVKILTGFTTSKRERTDNHLYA